MKVIFALAALLATGAAAFTSGTARQDPDGVVWRELMQYDVTAYADAVNRDRLEGARGAACVGFRVNNEVQGGAIIVGLDRPALGVFVGLNTPNEFINAPYSDLRVEFTLNDGTVHSVTPDAGGGISMLFHSPDKVSVAALRRVALYVNDSAEWAQ